MAVSSFLGGLTASLLIAEAAVAQPNPITSTSRLWLEWSVTPKVQWALGAVDSDADPDRTLNVAAGGGNSGYDIG